MIREKMRILTAVTLSAAMTAVPTVIQAETTPVEIIAEDGGSYSQEYGDVQVTTADTNAVSVSVADESSVKLKTGNLLTSDGMGLQVEAKDDGLADITVVGDISANGDEGSFGVYADSSEGGMISVDVTGDIESGQAIGVAVKARDGGVNFIDITGNVIGGGEALAHDDDDYDDDYDDDDDDEIWANGLLADAESGGENVVSVTGDVTGNARGLAAFAGDFYYDEDDDIDPDATSSNRIHIEGNLAGEDTGAFLSSDHGGYNYLEVKGNVISEEDGLYIKAYDNGVNYALIGGDIFGGVDGIHAVAYGEASNGIGVVGNIVGVEDGIYSSVYGDVLNQIFVSGNVESADTGICLFSEDDAVNFVYVKGDVSGDVYGIYADAEDASKNNVIVDGTVYGKNAICSYYYDDDNTDANTITVWRIAHGNDGYTAAYWEYDDETDEEYWVEDEEVEQKIQYIIKVAQPQKGASISAKAADGSALKTVDNGINGELDYALEGEKVLLKIDVERGYKLDAVYCDEDCETQLLMDAAGNYYMLVPRDGGVIFSVVVSKDTTQALGGESFALKQDKPVSSSSMIAAISAAATNSTVVISGTVTGTVLDASVVSTLIERSDVTFVFTCSYGGKKYKITIPAGTDLSAYINADGSISISKLIEPFGTEYK